MKRIKVFSAVSFLFITVALQFLSSCTSPNPTPESSTSSTTSVTPTNPSAVNTPAPTVVEQPVGLTRDVAKNIISTLYPKHKDDVMYKSGWCRNLDKDEPLKFQALGQLQIGKFITFEHTSFPSVSGGTIQDCDVIFTDKGKKYLVAEYESTYRVTTCDIKFLEISNIVEQPGQNTATVTYTTMSDNSPFALYFQLPDQIIETKKARLLKSDQGWILDRILSE